MAVSVGLTSKSRCLPTPTATAAPKKSPPVHRSRQTFTGSWRLTYANFPAVTPKPRLGNLPNKSDGQLPNQAALYLRKRSILNEEGTRARLPTPLIKGLLTSLVPAGSKRAVNPPQWAELNQETSGYKAKIAGLEKMSFFSPLPHCFFIYFFF